MKLYVKYVATCRCGRRITEVAMARCFECPKCGRAWRAPEERNRQQEEARRRGRVD